MRMGKLVCATVALAFLAGLGALRGDPNKEVKPDRVAGLIRQLGADEFDQREAASKALEALGEKALAALHRAAASSEDVEIRRRAERLAEAIELRFPFCFKYRKNLAGWEGLGQFWSVKDGALIGATGPDTLPFNTFLCSRRKYKDFELKFQVRVTAEGWAGNSGVQIRSVVVNPEKFIVQGPQCDIGEGYWGSLYGELFGGMMKAAPREVIAEVVKEGAFNDYFIRCVGRHVTIKVNGETTVDDEFPNLPEEGIIGWQLHGGWPMTVTFREIEFKELNGK